MPSDRDLGHHIRVMSNLLKRKVFELAPPPDGGEATAMQGRIMRYLYQRREEPVLQRDLEETFSIRRSTASRILTRMEEQGLVRREGVAGDRRLKRLVLTEKAVAFHADVETRIRRIEAILAAGLTEEEIAQFLAIAAKIEQNLS